MFQKGNRLLYIKYKLYDLQPYRTATRYLILIFMVIFNILKIWEMQERLFINNNIFLSVNLKGLISLSLSLSRCVYRFFLILRNIYYKKYFIEIVSFYWDFRMLEREERNTVKCNKITKSCREELEPWYLLACVVDTTRNTRGFVIQCMKSIPWIPRH